MSGSFVLYCNVNSESSFKNLHIIVGICTDGFLSEILFPVIKQFIFPVALFRVI
jgi:hypothetical protein